MRQQALEPVTERTAVVAGQTYAVLEGGALALIEALVENLGSTRLSPSDLTRIKVPSGGGVTWEVPTLEGVDSAKTIDGVIVAAQDNRAYWSTEEPAEGTPPDCASTDGENGRGTYGAGSKQNPSGRCGTCPLAQFGSGKNGVGQACKARKLLFMIRADDRLPVCVSVPAGSLANMRRYLVQLGGAGVGMSGAVTSLALEKAKASGGQSYAQVAPKLLARLDGAQTAAMREYADQFRAVLDGDLAHEE